MRYVIQNMSKYKPKPNVSLETLNLNFEQFKDVLSGNLPLLVKIFRNDLIVPEFATFCESVTTLYNKLKDNFNGEVRTKNLVFYKLIVDIMHLLACCLHSSIGSSA